MKGESVGCQVTSHQVIDTEVIEGRSTLNHSRLRETVLVDYVHTKEERKNHQL